MEEDVAQGHDGDFGDYMVSTGPYMFEGAAQLDLSAPPVESWDPERGAVVRAAVAFKASVVERDEKEASTRRILNLGHTVGHALERAAAGRAAGKSRGLARRAWPGIGFDEDYIADLIADFRRLRFLDDPFETNAMVTARVAQQRAKITKIAPSHPDGTAGDGTETQQDMTKRFLAMAEHRQTAIWLDRQRDVFEHREKRASATDTRRKCKG